MHFFLVFGSGLACSAAFLFVLSRMVLGLNNPVSLLLQVRLPDFILVSALSWITWRTAGPHVRLFPHLSKEDNNTGPTRLTDCIGAKERSYTETWGPVWTQGAEAPLFLILTPLCRGIWTLWKGGPMLSPSPGRWCPKQFVCGSPVTF